MADYFFRTLQLRHQRFDLLLRRLARFPQRQAQSRRVSRPTSFIAYLMPTGLPSRNSAWISGKSSRVNARASAKLPSPAALVIDLISAGIRFDAR